MIIFVITIIIIIIIIITIIIIIIIINIISIILKQFSFHLVRIMWTNLTTLVTLPAWCSVTE